MDLRTTCVPFQTVPKDLLAVTRAAASGLVEHEHRRTMSRMVAYANVAAMVGASDDWIRNFVNGYRGMTPDLVVGFNILVHWARVSTKRD